MSADAVTDMDEQAAMWVVELSEKENVTPEMMQQFQAWLRQDPRHGECYINMFRAWRRATEIVRRGT